MSQRTVLPLLFVVTAVFWLAVGYRVLAWQTGKLGAVTLTINRLDKVNRYMEWSPSADQYAFTSQHQLLLPAGATALFLVDPPARFGEGRVTVIASGKVDLNGEYRPDTVPQAGESSSRFWTWSELSRFPGGHRLHLKNLTDQEILITKIQLTFIP